MGPIGAQEMMFIFLLALLLFGPKKLPELGRMLGKGLTEFRRAKNELKSTFETHMQELEREARLSEKPEPPKWEQTASQPYTAPSYPYPYDEYGRQESASHTEPSSFANGSAAEETARANEPPRSEPVMGTVPRSAAGSVSEPLNAATEHEHPA